jgi:DNA-binding transcriptional MerR regulator
MQLAPPSPYADLGLVKMSALARMSGVPSATIKHYLREGLLPAPALRTSRNMALYDARLVERVKAIKDLQKKHFLPLKVIRGVLCDGPVDADDATVAAIQRALAAVALTEVRTRAQLVEGGMPRSELEFFCAVGLVTPNGSGEDETYTGDDLALLRTLGASRKAGITRDMLPKEIIEPYLAAIRELVRTELELFREGVVPRAGKNLAQITEAATKLSEQLVVLIRRKLLLPTLKQLVERELEKHARPPRATRGKKPRRKSV